VKNALTPPKGGQTGEDAAIETMIDKYDEVKGEARIQHSRAATTVENFQVTDMTDTRAVTEARITALRLIAFLNEADNDVRVKVAFRVRTVLSDDGDRQRQTADTLPPVSKPAVKAVKKEPKKTKVQAASMTKTPVRKTTPPRAPVPSAPTAGRRETARNGRFIDNGNGTVADTKTGLMWAAKDNGRYISWADAKSYSGK